MPRTGPPGRVVRIGPDRRLEAVARLVGAEGDAGRQARQFVSNAAAHRIDLDRMFCHLDPAGRITATTLSVSSPGRTAMFFSSHPSGPADVAGHAAAIDGAAAALAAEPVDLGQTLLEPAERLEREAYLAGGFRPLATLSYLQRPLPGPRRVPPPPLPDGVAIEPYAASRRAELVAVLDASYEQTLDCPGLYGLRRTVDVLAGHEATGEFDPALWFLLRVDGAAAGTLLLNPAPAQRSVELVYLGLAPSARGRGLGAVLLEHGLARLAGRRERTVALAVDERNEPALRLYRAADFQPVLRRVALIRPLA
ncbi:MAG: GNAT family N-acetyltransferase [Planctomycetota bacterium]